MFDEYLNAVTSCIKNKKLREPICTELESHLAEKRDFYIEIGYDEITAEQKAIQDMGSPTAVGENMSKLHKMSGGQIVVTVIFCIVQICLSLITLFDIFITIQYPSFSVFYRFVLLIATLLVSNIIALKYNKRIAPIFSLITSILNIIPIWCFARLTTSLITGNLSQYILSLSIMSDEKFQFFSCPWWFYVITSVIFIAVYVGLIYIEIRTDLRIKKVYSANFNKANAFKKILSVVLCLSTVILSISIYIAYNQEQIHAKTYKDACNQFYNLVSESPKYTKENYVQAFSKFSGYEFVEQTGIHDAYIFTATKNGTTVEISISDCGTENYTIISVEPSTDYNTSDLIRPKLIIGNSYRSFLKEKNIEKDIKAINVGESISNAFIYMKNLNFAKLEYECNTNNDSIECSINLYGADSKNLSDYI